MRSYFINAFLFIAVFLFIAFILAIMVWVITSCGFWNTMLMGDRALLGLLTGACS